MPRYPPGSFYFRLTFSGLSGDAAFQEASGISTEMEAEEVVCGGENRFKFKLPGIAKYNNLILKRGLIANGSKIASWCNDIISGGLNDTITTRTITVALLDGNSKVLVSWDFLNAYPVKWNVSDFRSMENAYAVETLEFAFTYFKKNT